MAESLARDGYIVLAPEHTGTDPLAPFGAFCPDELALPGVVGGSLTTNPDFDEARGEYLGDRLEPFFLPDGAPVGNPFGAIGVSVEVATPSDRCD
jgi:hypothetical protein